MQLKKVGYLTFDVTETGLCSEERKLLEVSQRGSQRCLHRIAFDESGLATEEIGTGGAPQPPYDFDW